MRHEHYIQQRHDIYEDLARMGLIKERGNFTDEDYPDRRFGEPYIDETFFEKLKFYKNDPRNWEISLGFEDVAIKQKKNICESRLDVDTTSEIIKGVHRPLPMMAANMSTVCNAEFINKLYKLGALGVMHRAAPKDHILSEITKIAAECEWVAGSIGVSEEDWTLTKEMIERGCNIIFIDIAHGYSDSVIETARRIKDHYPDVKVVVGNTTNLDFIYEAAEVADAIKVGIAQGFACETKNTAGCTEKQFSATLKFKEASRQLGIPVISDGAQREPADLVKAIGAGANSVMAGSIFARCPESAAEVIHRDGGVKKIYAGMACYSNDTEILTKTGWKLFKDLDKTEEVATLNPNTDMMEYQLPTKHYEFVHEGEMVSAKAQAVDLLVTPNHRMYVAKRHSIKGVGPYKFIHAENCINSGTFVYKKIASWDGLEKDAFKIPDVVEKVATENRNYLRTRVGATIPMDEWLDFFGFWLAEGSATKYHSHAKDNKHYRDNHFSYSIAISNNDKKIIDHYCSIIKTWGIKTFVRKRGKNYEVTINNKPLCNYLSQFGKAHEKYIPIGFKNLSSRLLKKLLHGIYLGDGSKSRNCIYTNSTQLRDDIHEISLKCGNSPSISLNHEKGTTGCINGREFTRNYDVWAVYLGNYWKNPHLHAAHHNIQKYSGKVYCVEVPNGLVCVRRNHTYVWCGNSRYVQDKWKGGLKDGTCPEGGVRLMSIGESLDKFLERWSGALKSGITYGGGNNIQSFQDVVEFVKFK